MSEAGPLRTHRGTHGDRSSVHLPQHRTRPNGPDRTAADSGQRCPLYRPAPDVRTAALEKTHCPTPAPDTTDRSVQLGTTRRPPVPRRDVRPRSSTERSAVLNVTHCFRSRSAFPARRMRLNPTRGVQKHTATTETTEPFQKEGWCS